MKKILFLAIFLAFGGFLLAQDANAGAEHNVSGWAWSNMDDPLTTADERTIGWISFNSKNCDANSDRISDGTPAGCPPFGTQISNYGVNINSNGTFTGYAWSENIGWIDFAPAGPYPDNSPNYYACLDLPGNGQSCDGIGNYNVGGWARACSVFQAGCSGALKADSERGGWDGWIKLRGANYGVSINSGNGNFSGYAWSDSVVGWIHFDGVNYKVQTSLSFNSPPNKPTTFETDWNRCAFRGGVTATLSWSYSDPENDPQTAYEIEVDDNSSFSAPKFNHLVNLPSTSYVLDLSQDDNPPDPGGDWISQLAWNSTYFWHVRVKDSFGNWSDWSNSSQSKTDKHPSPWVVFSWTPAQPTQGEIVEFNPDDTEIFGGTISSYLWTITQGAGNFIDSTSAASRYPNIIFSTPNNKVKLEITDTDGYSCESEEKDITVYLPLPEYKEVPPTSWFKKIFSGLFAFIF